MFEKFRPYSQISPGKLSLTFPEAASLGIHYPGQEIPLTGDCAVVVKSIFLKLDRSLRVDIAGSPQSIEALKSRLSQPDSTAPSNK